MLYQPVEQDADVIRDGLSRLRNRIRLLLREDRMICRPPSAATVQASPGSAHAQPPSAETKQAGRLGMFIGGSADVRFWPEADMG